MPGYWNAHSDRDWEDECGMFEEAAEEYPEPELCEMCGYYYADPPSKLCVGCDAYREHTGEI